MGFNLSVAVAVGFIALAGVAAETGVIMLIYLDHALEDRSKLVASEGRIAVPMIGGMVSSTLLMLVVIPAVYAATKSTVLWSSATSMRRERIISRTSSKD